MKGTQSALIVLLIFNCKVCGQNTPDRNHADSSLLPVTDSTKEGGTVTPFSKISTEVTTTSYTDTLVEKNCTQQKKITFMVSEVYLSLCYRLQLKCEGWLSNRKCKKGQVGVPCTRTRLVERFRYEPEEVCCAGFRSVNGTNLCERGCIAGYYGDRCQYHCPCSRNAYPGCDVDNGTCVCRTGWQGDICTQKCGTGWYGKRCQQKCLCENNATCHHIYGTCNCTTPGYTGDLCELRCVTGRFGYNCAEVCSCNERQTCSPETGLCNCKAGWTGTNCTTPCLSGFYGENCAKQCKCETNNTCHHVTGICECGPGFTGDRCDKTCEEGRYGEGCNSICPCKEGEVCNPVNGDCLTVPRCLCNALGTSNCIDHRPYCSCEDLRKYLVSSSESNNKSFEIGIVQNRCKNSIGIVQFCIPKDESCQCKPGWTGKTCGKVCPPSFYGLNCQNTCQCGPSETCNPRDGKCTAIAPSTVTPSTDIIDYILDETVSGFIVFGYIGIVGVSFFTVIAYCCCCRKPNKERKEKLKRIEEINKETNDVAMAMYTFDNGVALHTTQRSIENNNERSDIGHNGTMASVYTTPRSIENNNVRSHIGRNETMASVYTTQRSIENDNVRSDIGRNETMASVYTTPRNIENNDQRLDIGRNETMTSVYTTPRSIENHNVRSDIGQNGTMTSVYTTPRSIENNNVRSDIGQNGTMASFKYNKSINKTTEPKPSYDIPCNGRPVPLHYCNSVWQGDQCTSNPVDPEQNHTRKTKIINVATDFNRTNSVTEEQLQKRIPVIPSQQNKAPYMNLHEDVDLQSRREMYDAVRAEIYDAVVSVENAPSLHRSSVRNA